MMDAKTYTAGFVILCVFALVVAAGMAGWL